MIKIAVNSLLLASAIGLTACSNSDDSPAQSNGGAAFMHSVPDVGFIYADGTRPYGTISYRSITGVLSLEPGTYSVAASQLNLDDPVNSPEILSGASFAVSESKIGLHVFSGSYGDENIGVSLTSLSLTDDTDGTSDILIKVANINPKVGSVDVYFVESPSGSFDPGDYVAANTPSATIAQKASSETIKLKSAEQRLIVADPDTDEILFDSGLKTLLDSKNQIIVLTESTSETEDFTAVYYRVTAMDLWSSNDGQSEVRVFNALNVDDVNAAAATNVSSADPAVDLIAAPLSIGSISDPAVMLPSSTYEVAIDHTSGSLQSHLSFASGLKLTIAVVGSAADANDIDVVKIEDDQQNIFTESKISITHLGYNEVQAKTYEVHFLREGVSQDLDTRVPEVSELDYKETAKFSKNKAKYSVVVRKAGSNTSLQSIQLDLTDGANHQLAIIQDGNSYKVCDFTKGVLVNSCDK